MQVFFLHKNVHTFNFRKNKNCGFSKTINITLAIDLIKHLLQVKRRRRLTVERAMLHDYFKVSLFSIIFNSLKQKSSYQDFFNEPLQKN